MSSVCLSLARGLWLESTMPDDKDFQVKVQRIGELVDELENIADPEARASAKALVQLLLDLHGAGLERVMEIVAKDGDPGSAPSTTWAAIRWSAACWFCMAFILWIWRARVAQAVERVRPQVRKSGGELDLLGIEDGAVRLHLQVTGHSCGSTGKTLQEVGRGFAVRSRTGHELACRLRGSKNRQVRPALCALGKLGGVIAAASARE